jgi:TolB-like protein/DNA-binding winged helix-turn-helix (wHTH) protein/Flp pilus assembly protein TadD
MMISQLQKRYLLEEFWLEPDKQLLSREGEPVHLSKKPFQVLVQLVEQRDRFVGRAELLDLFWDGRDVYDDALRKSIGAIRKALDDQADTPRFIETRWGVGYRYVGPLEVQLVQGAATVTEIEKSRGVRIVVEEEEISDEVPGDKEVKLAPAATLSLPNALKHSRRLTAFVLIFASVALGAVAVFSSRINSRRNSSGSSSLTEIRSTKIRTIAVLPLKNLSGDAESDYFSDGITENLINTLSRIEGLNVISRGSAFAFKGKDVDPREVGEKLKVGALLEGSVLKRGGRVRVDVRLVSTNDGRVLWANNIYDRPLGDIFTVQDEIARNAAAGLRLELSGKDQQRLAKHYTDNVEAYEELLRGWYFWTQRTPSGLRKAIASYQRAVELDPHCAVAYAGLAGSYAMGIWYIPLEPKEAMRKAKLAANKAMEIDSSFPEVHLAMSHVLGYEWDWSGAEREMERARELDPNFSTYGYAYTLLSAGKPDEAVLWIKRSEKLDPLSPLVSANVGQILYYARRYDEAIEQCRKTLGLDPNYAMAHTFLGQAYIQKGMHREAVEQLQKAISLSEHNPEVIAILGYAYAAGGNRQEAEKILKQLTELSNRTYVPAYSVAEIYAVLDRKDEAFAWLQKAYEEHAPGLGSLKVEPTLDSLRSDARYAELLRRTREGTGEGG